jgi:cysteine synthase A
VGLAFVAVMPRSTSVEKVALIESFGGQCHLVDDPGSVYRVAAELARDRRGHYMDQFTNAERANGRHLRHHRPVRTAPWL